MIPRYTASVAKRAFLAVTLGIVFHLSACHPAAPAVGDEAAHGKARGETAKGVTLTKEQVAKLGIVTEAAKATDYLAETSGYGVVIPHEPIAAAVAELTTAELTERQTQTALARAQGLNGTPGALSAELEDAASRQSAADSAGKELAARRLSSVIGLHPPWKPAKNTIMLQALASGRIKLLRATFPLGTVQGREPRTLRAAHLEALQAPSTLESISPQAPPGSELTSVWDAPADSSMPGRSFFALLEDDDFAEGERLLVWARGTGPAQAGVLVPAAALVIGHGKYWCYLEDRPGHYHRIEVNTERPVNDGYVVTDGIPVGAKVVTSAAGLLLARESNPATDAN